MIFLTNDDGIEAQGLKVLASALETIDEVYAVAPDRERSAIGMAITLHRPLRVRKIVDKRYAVDGTPVDCVDLAVGNILPEKPKLLVSGINRGQNLGHDIHFSGTVAAAIKGTFMEVPSIAISLVTFYEASYKHDFSSTLYFDTAVDVGMRVIKAVLRYGLPKGVLLNVNVPNIPLSKISGLEITRQDMAAYDSKVVKRVDPRGSEYYWIGGDREEIEEREGTDLNAVIHNRVSITPLQLDFTSYSTMEQMKEWEF